VTGTDGRTHDLLIRDVTVIDGTGSGPRTAVNVLVEDGRIRDVGSALAAPEGTPEIDGSGKHLIPGLWETQAHLCENSGKLRPAWYSIPPDGPARIAGNLAAYLRLGVTTVVDLGGRVDVLKDARDAQRNGTLQGARMLLAGGHFNYPGGPYVSPWMNNVVSNVADARREIERAIAEDGINIMKAVYSHGWPSAQPLPKMSPDILRALVEGAHAENIPAAVHADGADDVVEAVGLGVDSPEHMFQPGPDWPADRDRVIEVCVQAGAYWQMTIALFEMMAHARDHEWLRTRVGVAKSAELDAAEHDPESLWLNIPEEDRLDSEVRFEAAMDTALAGYRAGMRMTISTDSGVSAIFHGLSTHREMELHSRAGIPNLHVITMATRYPAEKLRRGHELGTVEAGKIADLVLLRDDPLRDITNTRAVDAVIQGGRVLRAEELAEAT
jgi:imidazolonepropionase-like amidohydrolase